MSSAFKTLTISDFSVLPYIALKDVEFTNCYINGAGFRTYKGTNTPQSITGSLPEEALIYRSAKHLYYTAQLSASLGSGSAYYDYLQSTASPGSYQADLRNFPTQSGATIKVFSIPQYLYGEAIAPKTFKLISSTNTYYIVDDGNGNLVDTVDCASKTGGTPIPSDSEIYNTDLLYTCIKSGSVVGNIIYPQGIVIITDTNYDCVFDLGPTTSDIYEVFLSTDDPKTITLIGATVTDCSGVDLNTFELIPVEGSTFPNYSIINGVIVLDEADPLTSTEGTYYIRYRVTSDACIESNTSLIVVSIINCEVVGGEVVIQPSATPAPTPSITPTKTSTPLVSPSVTPTFTPTSTKTPTPTGTPTITPTSTLTPSVTPTNTPTPTKTMTPTPTSTLINTLPLGLCLRWENTTSPQTARFYARLVTPGDLFGAPINTNVTAVYTVGLQTNQGTYYLSNQTITINNGTYYSGEVEIQLPGYSISGVSFAYISNLTPAASSTQVYTSQPYGLCANSLPCTSCSPQP